MQLDNVQETQLLMRNRATRLAILIFEKYRYLKTGVKGLWRLFKVSPFDTAHATSY